MRAAVSRWCENFECRLQFIEDRKHELTIGPEEGLEGAPLARREQDSKIAIAGEKCDVSTGKPSFAVGPSRSPNQVIMSKNAGLSTNQTLSVFCVRSTLAQALMLSGVVSNSTGARATSTQRCHNRTVLA
jgi:hypothetical protein